ncbi:hypothetical protein [Alishewanella longhuensis]
MIAFTFNEINPAVINAAEQHFSYLADSAAKVEVYPPVMPV